jgi:alkanesulfonate monooxygenase SsuD/methylene tetrahydromethanopterin reductase-like flavin-dependent oxidoreductase (luciferase family)
MPPAVNHPARVAERIATLDLVSKGRAEWGTGEMSSRIELEGFGVNYVEKRAMWAEAVRETAKMMCSEPYPGFEGKYFSMPARNIVPKPVQKAHPPLWIACTNRDTLKLAARLGAGALTFAFMDPGEAKFWVEEYYEIFRRECRPIGQAVNPNVATLVGFMCQRNGDAARASAVREQKFFKYGLAHYYRFGVHTPGRSNIWREFEAATDFPMAGLDGVGSPEEISARFREYEAVGVDQLILLQQAGTWKSEEICRSLELFGAEVIGEFIERDAVYQVRKQVDLAPFVKEAMQHVERHVAGDIAAVEAYPSLWERHAGKSHEQRANRAVETSSLWNLHVGGGRKNA